MLQKIPDSNRLWASFPEADREALTAEIRLREFKRGDILIQADAPVSTVFFPIAAQLSDVMVLADGRSSSVASVGREGAAGLSAFLTGAPSAWNVEVHIEGSGFSLPAAALRRRTDVSPALALVLTRVNHAAHIEAAQNAACAAASHTALARVARWLLRAQDCTGADVIRVSQEDVAKHLSLRRTTVTAAASLLRSAGACSYLRQRIVIERREVLEAHACDCYDDLARRRDRRCVTG